MPKYIIKSNNEKELYLFAFPLFTFILGCKKSVEDYNRRGESKNYKGNYTGAIIDFTKAIELGPNNPISYYNRGDAWIKLEEYQGGEHHLTEAISDYTKVIELDSKRSSAYSDRGFLKAEFNDHSGAIVDYNKALELDPEKPYIYFLRGESKAQLMDFSGAIKDYNKTIERSFEFINAYNKRGESKAKLGDHEGAIFDFSKSIEISRKDQEKRYASQKSRNKTDTINSNLRPNYYLEPLIFSMRGDSKAQLEDYRGAITDYSKAIELTTSHSPSPVQAYYGRGLAKIKTGQKDSGCLDLSKGGEFGHEAAYKAIKEFCGY